MEDTLRECPKLIYNFINNVLILVLMEDTLRGTPDGRGGYEPSLNPCFNGRYSQRGNETVTVSSILVLILVLMEDTLRGIRMPEINYKNCVLILVLMEDTLRGKDAEVKNFDKGLNPCFNGRYSQSKKKFGSKIQKPVLILVLMEDTLRAILQLPTRLFARS